MHRGPFCPAHKNQKASMQNGFGKSTPGKKQKITKTLELYRIRNKL